MTKIAIVIKLTQIRFTIFIILVVIFYPFTSFSIESKVTEDRRLSMPLALGISVIPGFGAGNYYAHNFSKGLTFTFIDASIVGITIWAYSETKITDYSIVSLGIIPAILLILKFIQAKSVYEDVEAYNSRYIFHSP